MKNKYRLRRVASVFAVLLLVFGLTSCHRDDDEADDLPQEDITNLILKVTDDTGKAESYNFLLGSATFPTIKLVDGKTYTVEAQFMNGTDDVTGEIKEAKDNHFLIFNFPNSKIDVERLDGDDSTTATHKVGLKTKWTVNKVNNSSNAAALVLTLKHAEQKEDLQPNEAAVTSTNGIQWGTAGAKAEDDAVANFGLSN